jgi:integrase
MAAKLLTDLAIEKVKPDPRKRVEIPDRQKPGLYLVVQPSGKRSFAVRTRLAGKPIKVTLGQVGKLDLAAARRQADEVLKAAQRGEDPRVEPVAPKITTVADAVEEFVTRYAKPRLRSWKDVNDRLHRDLVSRYGSWPLASLTRVDVVRMLDGMADRGLKQGANRVFAHTRKLLSWCVERGMIAASPAAGIKPPAKEIARDRVLEDEEVAAIWKACGSLGFPFGPLMRMLMITAQRRGEVAGMRRLDVDIARAIWTLPREQTKAGRLHTVPLSDLALDTLAGTPRLHDGELVFSVGGLGRPGGWSRAKAQLDGVAGVTGWRLHDLRRTAASTMARLGHPPHVVAAVLNHAPGSTQGITAIYNRFRYDDEKRAALDAWARHVDRLVNGTVAAVVELRGSVTR